MKSKAFATLASTLAIAWAGAAYAQNAEGASSQDLQNPSSGAAGNAAPSQTASPDESATADIIVTAQRRSERLVDVPISIAVASGLDLERAGPTTLESLTKVTPGVYLQRATYGLSPTIRGIGSTLADSNNEQNVALYVDGIYYPTPTGNVFDLASVSGVEVLKGPQGTLFGRNATGGAILIHTLDPGFTTEGRFNVSYERFNQIRSSAYVNIPLGDKVALNGSVAYRYSDGYVHDLKTGATTNRGRNFTARGKLLIEPNDSFSVIFTAAHSDFNDPSGSDSRSFIPARAITLLGGGPVATDQFHSSFNTMQSIKTSTDEYSGRAKLDVGGGTLTSLTSYQYNKLDALNDIDLSYLNQNINLSVFNKTFTQELNFASSKEHAFSYIAGLYYYHNKSGTDVVSTGVPVTTALRRNESISVYLDGTYKLGDLSLIAGIRYSSDKRDVESAPGAAKGSPFTRFQDAVDKEWTPRVGLSYALSQRTNIYATYSKGFKSGVFDATTATGPGVEPEKVDAFEVGVKSASRAISFNAAAFYYDYTGTQVNASILVGNAVVTQLFNVPKARIYGAEADMTLRLTDNFDIRAAIAYTHARYVDFKNAPAVVDNPLDPAALGGLLYSNSTAIADGNSMVRAPDFTASSTLSYHTDLDASKTLELTLSPYYSSRVYFTFDNSLSQKPYVTLDAAASLTLNKNVKFSIFGRNLTNDRYFISLGQSALSLKSGKYATPRTYGVSLGYTF